MKILKVKNWQEFQHYKDRNPPWIKLHRSLLTDYKFACLQDASKLHLVMIWLLASQTDNEIPADPKFLQNALHLDQEPNLNELIEKGFLFMEQDASSVLAGRKQVAMPETETETDNTSISDMEDSDTETPEDRTSDFQVFWEVYPKKSAKKKAETAWNRLPEKKKAAALQDIKRGRFDKVDRQFIPHPTTYLNGERWEDEMPEQVTDAYAGAI